MKPRFDLNFDSRSHRDFWKHLHKECVLQIVDEGQRKARKDLLLDLQDRVERGQYRPSPLIGKLSSAKSNGVPRFIPVFEAVDYSVYFGCIKTMDRALASHAVPNTFGGWALGGDRRKAEEEQMKIIFDERFAAVDALDADEYFPGSAYTKHQWFKNWQQFWRLLDTRFGDGRYPVIAKFDIANFYDSVELGLLESELRAACPAQARAVDVLQFFLTAWDSEHRPYQAKVKGLPQDVVGDSSRILANFFLTPFDRVIQAKASSLGAEYVRWADDAYIGCRSANVARDLIYFATEQLNRRGLSISAPKVDYLSAPMLNEAWRFDILRAGDEESFDDGMTLLDTAWDTEFSRRPTCFKMAISKVAYGHADPAWKSWIMEKIGSHPEMLLMFNDSQFKNLFRIYDSTGNLFVNVILPVHRSSFTHTKAALLRAMSMFKPSDHRAMLETAERIMRASLAASGDAASIRLSQSHWNAKVANA